MIVIYYILLLYYYLLFNLLFISNYCLSIINTPLYFGVLQRRRVFYYLLLFHIIHDVVFTRRIHNFYVQTCCAVQTIDRLLRIGLPAIV